MVYYADNTLAPVARVETCERCPALAESRERIAWGVGAFDAELLVVGEPPGAGGPDADRWRGGDQTGMADTARHGGRRIRERFGSLGYAPESLYFTSAVERFPGDGNGSNREQTDAERSNCRPHLLEEIGTIETGRLPPLVPILHPS